MLTSTFYLPLISISCVESIGTASWISCDEHGDSAARSRFGSANGMESPCSIAVDVNGLFCSRNDCFSTIWYPR